MINLNYYLSDKQGNKTTPVYKQFADAMDAGELLEYIDSLVRKFRVGDFYKSLRIVVKRSVGADPCFQHRLFDFTFNFNLNKYGKTKKNT